MILDAFALYEREHEAWWRSLAIPSNPGASPLSPAGARPAKSERSCDHNNPDGLAASGGTSRKGKPPLSFTRGGRA